MSLHYLSQGVLIRYLKFKKPSPLGQVVVVCMVGGGAGGGAGDALPLVYEDLVVVVLAGLRRLHLHQVLHLLLLLLGSMVAHATLDTVAYSSLLCPLLTVRHNSGYPNI